MLNLDHFVADCRAALTASSPQLAIKEILERALTDPAGVEAAVGTPRRAQIASLHHERDLTILIRLLMKEPPPDHDFRRCAICRQHGIKEI